MKQELVRFLGRIKVYMDGTMVNGRVGVSVDQYGSVVTFVTERLKDDIEDFDHVSLFP